MHLTVDRDHPISEALQDAPMNGHETWLLIKSTDGTSYLRAAVQQWRTDGELTHIDFETWEEYMDRRAKMAGL